MSSSTASYARSCTPPASRARRLTPETEFTPKPGYYETCREYQPAGLPAQPSTHGIAFSETSDTIAGRFLDAWKARGGLRIIGLPLTRSYPRQQDDGSWLLVQDFERAGLEYHPKYARTVYEVLLGLLNRDALLADRWLDPIDQRLPAWREFQ